MWSRGTLVAGLLLLSPIAFAAELPPVEPMPTLAAATLAPAALLDGAGYTVDADVPVVGYMGQFTLRAPAGTFAANGTEMLRIRVGELAAIAQLNQMSQSGVFADALAASAAKTGAALSQAVMNPVETLIGIPSGIGRFFQSASTTIERATETPQGPNSAQSVTDTTDQVLGINQAKRRIAKQVGADPYTTNPVLAKQLDDLARAAFAGGVSLDVALAVSTAGVATAISTTARVSDLVWSRSPQDIRTLHEQKLAALGVDPETIRAFVTNRWLTPTLSVPIVEALEGLPDAKGRPAVVALAGGVASEGEARFIATALGMARRSGNDRDPVIALDLDGRILVTRTRDGRVAVPAPVDYVVWTQPVRAFAERTERAGRQAGERHVLVTGIASARARDGLGSAGWRVTERSAP